MCRRTLATAAALLVPALFTFVPVGQIAAATVPLPFVGEARDVAVQSDGKIVAAFQSQASLRFRVVRLLADGATLDSTFGGDGIVETDLQPTGFSVIHDIAVQPDGRMVAAGYTGTVLGVRNFGVVRYRTDGSLDPTFGGGDGIAITDLAGQDTIRLRMALTPKGSIIIAAQTEGLGNKLVLARYGSDGSPDVAFGIGGVALHDLPGALLAAYDVASDAAGDAVVGGGTYNEFGGASQHMLARITPTGALDPTFGVGGW
jgi:uncharacterized delta-60 repeat protein